MSENNGSFVKNHTLLIKMLISSALLVLVVSLCLILFIFFYNNQRLINSHLFQAQKITLEIENKIKSNIFSPLADLNETFALYLKYKNIEQLNLISPEGEYIASSSEQNISKTASQELLQLLNDQDSKLKQININLGDKPVSLRQYTTKYELEYKSHPQYYFQVLFNNYQFDQEQNLLFRYFIYVLLSILSFILILVFLNYYYFTNNIEKIKLSTSDPNLKVDSELDSIKNRQLALYKNSQDLKAQLAEEKLKHQVSSDNNHNQAEVMSVNHFKQLIIGIKIVNYEQLYKNISQDQFGKINSGLYNFFNDQLKSFKIQPLAFEASEFWFAFADDNKYKSVLYIIDQIEAKAKFFAENYNAKISKGLKLAFIVNEGDIVMADIKTQGGRYFSVGGGSAYLKAKDLFASTKEAGIWSFKKLSSDFSNLCYVNDLDNIGNYSAEVIENLVSLSHQAKKKKKTLSTKAQPKQTQATATKTKGIMNMLDTIFEDDK